MCYAPTSVRQESKPPVNRNYRVVIQDKAVYIHGSTVNLMHEFVYVPLVYSKLTDMSMQSEQGKNRADDPVAISTLGSWSTTS